MSASELPTDRDAYALLSAPTLSLTDEDVTVICADLRQRRERFLQGIADKPVRKKAEPVSEAQKAANTAEIEDLLDGIKL